MADKPRYYLTTPIYYANDVPHIGHAYTSLASDVLARFKRLDGYDVIFLTGTDEHGQKIAKAAADAGMEPQPFTDKVSQTFRDLARALNLSNDEFIRTTEVRHKKACQALWNELFKRGEIYLGKYAGWYAVRDEAYYGEDELSDAPNGRKVAPSGAECEWVEEPSYFFKLSQWGERLLAFYEKNPNFILPHSRRNEVLSFVKSGLRDLSISRTSLTWGVAVPLPSSAKDIEEYLASLKIHDVGPDRREKLVRKFGDETLDVIERDPDRLREVSGIGPKRAASIRAAWSNRTKHVMYVWLDALTNYITAVGYPDTQSELYQRYWPADLHMVGKDILRFHAVYWPAFLMAADLEPPKRIFAHGWWTNEGQKISKSLGNVIDPYELMKTYGLDPTRYFLLREVPFGNDGDFSRSAMIRRINSELANDLGNLAQRSLAMISKNCGAKVPNRGVFTDADEAFLGKAHGLLGQVRSECDIQAFHKALDHLWFVIGESNRYIDEQAPWALRKTDPARMETVLYVLAEVLRHLAILIQPFMPDAMSKLLDQLAVPADERDFAALTQAHALKPGTPLLAPQGVFPRYVDPEPVK